MRVLTLLLALGVLSGATFVGCGSDTSIKPAANPTTPSGGPSKGGGENPKPEAPPPVAP